MQNRSLTQMLSTPTVEWQKRILGVTLTFLGLMCTIYRFWGVCTYLSDMSTNSIMPFFNRGQIWSIDFLGINKLELAKQICRLAQPLFRVCLLNFLKRRARDIYWRQMCDCQTQIPYVYGANWIDDLVPWWLRTVSKKYWSWEPFSELITASTTSKNP